MSLRQFGSQNAATTLVPGKRRLSWLELRCPSCGTATYIQGRERRLARTGSGQEYTPCVGCGVRLTLGRLVTHPNDKPLWERLRFWRRNRETLIQKRGLDASVAC